jgi:hypothetical protein
VQTLRGQVAACNHSIDLAIGYPAIRQGSDIERSIAWSWTDLRKSATVLRFVIVRGPRTVPPISDGLGIINSISFSQSKCTYKEAVQF